MSFNQRFAYTSIILGFIFCLYANQAWSVSDQLTVKFLDIGQGDSILIQTPHGRTVLVDGGPGSALLERLNEETSFWMKEIDLVVSTHPDLDHVEGLVDIVERYDVGLVLITGMLTDTALSKAFSATLERENIAVAIAAPEQDWELDDGVFLDILAPTESVAGKVLKKTNDEGIVAKLVYGETSLLLTADIEKIGEDRLLRTDNDLRAQLLKVGHHGSRTSSTLPFLEAVSAREAVMINGKENSYGHPHLQTVLSLDEKGIDWISTKDVGTVTMVSDGREWSTFNY